MIPRRLAPPAPPAPPASLDPFRVKVIDFGIAKATSARLTEKTIFTEFRQMIGTPEYMSPEQAGESNEDVDTRTDVYSAGVLLYELLTGSTPFDSRRLRSAAFGEMQRIIREEDPPKPSTKIRSRAETLDAIAAARAMSPAKLPGAVRGELDWIVMKAMEKDRSRRNDSAGSMARDLQRYLAGDAVHAAPPSRVYVARKFIRRHRGPVLAASLLAMALVAGLIGTSVGFLNAEAQRQVAEGETARAEGEKERADEHAANAIAQKQAAEWQTYRANMSAAITSLEAGQPARVRVRLDACPPNLRGWEWTYVRNRLDMSKRRLIALDYPGMGYLDADFSPDGTTFVTPFKDPARQRFGARIADARTGHTRRTLLGGHTDQVYFTKFNRDGTKVLTGSSDGSARVYDATNGREIVVLHTGAAEVRRVTFDLTDERCDRSDTLSEPAGWIIAVTGDGLIHVFDETTYKLIARQQYGAVYTAFRIPGTRSIVLTQGFDPPMIWHVGADDAASVNVEPLLPEYPLCNWAIPSLDGTRVAACYSNQVVRVIDLSSRRMLTTIRGHLAQMGGMAFSPDGSRLVTASLDSTVRVWDPSSGEQLRVLFGHEGYIWSVDFNADGSEILTAGNGAVLAWNTRAIDDRESLSTHGIQGYDSIAYSPDGSLLVTSSLKNGVRLHDARTHQLLREIDAAPSTHIEFSKDGKRLASVRAILAGAMGPADTVHLWDASTWESLAVINPPPSGVNAVALNTDGSRIAVSTWNHGGHLYDGEGNLIASMPGFGHWAGGMTFTPDGSVLLAGMRGDRLFQWRAADGARLADSPIAVSGLNSLVCNSSGSCVIGATEAGYAVLWDAGSGKVIHELRGHGGPLRGAAFFAGGSRIVTAGRDGTVRLWDSASGEEVAMFRTMRPFSEVLAVNPNGEEIAAIFDDIDAQFFGIAPDRNQRAASGSASSREP